MQNKSKRFHHNKELISMDFPSLQDIETLDRKEQIEAIKKLRLTNRIHEMAEGFGFKNSSMYYNWLKKLQIYEDLCGKKNIFNPVVPQTTSDLMHTGSSYSLWNETDSSLQVSHQIMLSQHSMKFKYDLEASGSQAAALLRKIAAYIEDEESPFSISLRIEK